MNDQVLYETWYMWLAIAAVVIVAAVALLIMVIMAARRILNLAVAALGLVEQIKDNTSSIWGLQKTNEIASTILQDAKDIDSHLSLVSDALHELDNKN